jgi:hypothetical protein
MEIQSGCGKPFDVCECDGKRFGAEHWTARQVDQRCIWRLRVVAVGEPARKLDRDVCRASVVGGGGDFDCAGWVGIGQSISVSRATA